MAKTVDQFSTIEDFRKRYNELAVEVGDKTGLRTTATGTLVDAVNSLEDKSFYFQEFVYTATASQTTFTGTDAGGNTLKLRKDRLQVFKNGAHLIEGTNFNITGADTAGNYTNVVLTAGASAGDIIVIYAFTGSYLGTTSGTAGGGGHWTETAAETIYNLNNSGVILNGSGTPNQTVELEDGYKIQLAGKTYVEDDMRFVNNKSVTIGGTGRFVGDLNGNADTVTNGVYTTDTNTVTGTIIAANTVTNTNMVNDSVTIGSTEVDLGATVTTFAGLSSVTSTTFVGALTGNATTSSTTASITGHSLQNLANVGASASPSDGQVLSWDNSASEWTNTNPAATFTAADARAALSGGDGISYNSSTGVIANDVENGVIISGGKTELDYETVSSAPTGVGSTATGHLWFVI